MKKQFHSTVLGHLKTGGTDVPDDVRKGIIELVKRDTGLTPALKVVDAAFAKRHRATVMKALTKVHTVIEENTKVFQRAAVPAMNAANDAFGTGAYDALNDIAMCIKDFNGKVIKLETDIAKELEDLQEAKGTTGVKVEIISLEGDMKGAVEKFKKDIKNFKDLEKKFKVMDKVDKMAETMRTYSDAAARTQVTEARKALEKFFDWVDDIIDYKDTVKGDKSKPDDDYVEAIGTLCKYLKAIKDQRGKVSMTNLKQLEAAGA
jgi:hypothetical protein